jgi:16S rRNA (cytosine1402-N4)-methyltransferase
MPTLELERPPLHLHPHAGLGYRAELMTDHEYQHQPVLLAEVLERLITDPGGLYLDCTLGLGGHSEAILRAISQNGGKLLGLDMDPESIHLASRRLHGHENFQFARGNFRDAARVLKEKGFFPLAGALYDLGVSSMHFDKGERGFSFQHQGPLDMRLSPDNPLTADAIVNIWPEEQIALLLKEFGEEPSARKIARSIVERRAKRPFTSTTDLAEHLEKLLPRVGKSHQATRTFQALRIAVNAELENLSRGLESILPYLGHGARLCVITFHSLEDKIVKTLFASFVAQGACKFVEGGQGAIKPSAEEVERNPRARSAKLRVVEKQ